MRCRRESLAEREQSGPSLPGSLLRGDDTRAALESAFAYGARASYYSGNYKTVNEICTAGLNNLKAGGLTASWKMVCVN